MKKRVISMLLSVLMIFSLVPVSVFADETGTTGGGVTLTKELVSMVPDEDGNYTLKLTVSGDESEQEIGETAGDIILVIDNSGSMSDHVGAGSCPKTGADIKAVSPEVNESWWGYTEKVYPCPECGHRYTEYYWDNDDEPSWSDLPADSAVCGRRTQGTPRMDIAKTAAKQFAKYVLDEAPGSEIAVIGFAGSNGGVNDNTAIKVNTGLSGNINSINTAIDGMVANGGTNYTAALSAANTMLNNREDHTRPGYVIFLTDGAPGRSGGSVGSSSWDGSVQAASIRGKYTLFTIGILLDSNTAISHLESLATPPKETSDGTIKHFINLDDEGTLERELSGILEDWAGELIKILAGTDAVLTDEVSDDFEIVEVIGADADYEGDTVTWEIGDITEEPKTIDIKIKPKDGLSGTVETNEECKLTYTDPNEDKKTKYADPPELEFVKINVTKVWDVADGTALPEKVTVGLNADDESVKTITLTGKDNWTGSFSSLPKYKLVDGEPAEIDYTDGYELYEVSLADYIADIGEITGSNGEYSCTITNSPATETITVTKVWDDADNQDGKRPADVEIHIIDAETDKHLHTPVYLSAEDKEDDNENVWSVSVPIPAGKTIELEEAVPDGYSVSYDYDEENGIYTVTNAHIPETIEWIVVEKDWEDNENKDGSRPEEITVHLHAHTKTNPEPELVKTAKMFAADGWQEAVFTNLPKYADGEEIIYTVSEDAIKDNAGNILYSYAVSDTVENGVPVYTVTNTYPANPLAITVSKVWNDDNNRDGLRKDVTVNLLADGAVKQTATLTETGGWEHTFDNLPRYDAGDKIEYTVTEVSIADYTSIISGDMETGFTITNTHESATYGGDDDDGYEALTVTKIWKDGDNNDGKRPESIQVKLMNGSETVDTITLTGDPDSDTWTGTFKEVYVYENGDEIPYTVKEVGVPAGYASNSEQVEDDNGVLKGFVITNTYSPAATTFTVNKVWDDDNNRDGIRPESVTVELLADGKKTNNSVVLSGTNGWTYTKSEAKRS